MIMNSIIIIFIWWTNFWYCGWWTNFSIDDNELTDEITHLLMMMNSEEVTCSEFFGRNITSILHTYKADSLITWVLILFGFSISFFKFYWLRKGNTLFQIKSWKTCGWQEIAIFLFLHCCGLYLLSYKCFKTCETISNLTVSFLSPTLLLITAINRRM